MPMISRRYPFGLARTLLFGAIGAGIVHICATLAVPYLAVSSAYPRLAGQLRLHEMVVAPPATPATALLPYQQPDMVLALCRYDAGRQPVVIRAVLPDGGWTLGLYAENGDNFYVIPGQDARRTDVHVVLIASGDPPVPPAGLRGAEANLAQIQLPAPTGIMIIRAPLRGEAYPASVRAQLASASCAPIRS
jgi:uncharacterized membrane protein